MKLKVILITAGAVVLAGAAVCGYLYLNEQHKVEIDTIQSELDSYKATYDGVGDIINGYALAVDKDYGEIISAEDLVEVPVFAEQNIVINPEEIVGKYYRINLMAGTPLTTDMIMEYQIGDDERAYDVITSYNPIGIRTNDYVDIRFVTPMGEDYIAIAHKRVEGIYNGVLKLAMSEYDIAVYNSLLVDKILLKGSIVYAAKYLEPGGQTAAEEFYPLSNEILVMTINDPNINAENHNISIEEIYGKRKRMLQSYEEYCNDELISSLLESGKDAIESIIQSGQSDYQTQEEIRKQKELEEAILAQQNGGE